MAEPKSGASRVVEHDAEVIVLKSDPPKVSIGKIMRPPAAQLGAKSK